MKPKNLFKVCLLFLAISSFVSCDKDDKIDISQLKGTWSVVYDDPNLSVDGFVTYTFNEDKTCNIYCYDALSNRDTTINRTYIVSLDQTLITLFNEENRYTEQYNILKLTSKTMEWKNATPSDGKSDKKLVKE
ncbi:MAG: hypothetical protein H6Q13_2613 [Bacteroidetes bacterium]|nr:hypothetical protein [Bacteroidota bacterium]